MKYIHLLYFILIFTSISCGYKFQGGDSILPTDVKTVYIPLAKNRSLETSLTNLLTEAVRDRFGRFGVVNVVETKNEADAILTIEILKVRIGKRSGNTKLDTSIQQDLKLVLFGELRKKNGSVLWRNPNLEVSKSYATNKQSIVTSGSDFATSTLGSNDISNLSERELARGQGQESLQTLCDVAAKQMYDEAVAPDF